MTPPPNAVISTSGDPTPTLPAISSSPIHSSPAPSGYGGNPMYHHTPPGHNHVPGNMHHGGAMHHPHMDPSRMHYNPQYNPMMMAPRPRYHGGNMVGHHHPGIKPNPMAGGMPGGMGGMPGGMGGVPGGMGGMPGGMGGVPGGMPGGGPPMGGMPSG